MFVLFASSLVNTWMTSLQSNNGDRTKPTTELLGDTISHARNLSFFYPLWWPIYVFNSVVNTKFPAIHIYIYIYIYIYIMRGKNDATTYPDKPVSWIASLFRGLILLYFIIIFLYLYLYILYLYIYIYIYIYIFMYLYIFLLYYYYIFYYLYIYTQLYFIPLLHACMV